MDTDDFANQLGDLAKILEYKQKADYWQQNAAEAKAIVDLLYNALIWCSGSYDFTPEGKAHNGWKKVARPAMQTAVKWLERQS